MSDIIVNFDDLPEFAKQAIEKRFTDEEGGYVFELNNVYEWSLNEECVHDIEIDFNDYIETTYGDVEFIVVDT